MIREELQPFATSIDNLQPHPRNVREGDIGAISESLKAHGQYRPIVFQASTGYVLAGNHTLKAAKALGWTEIAATPVNCNDEQALRILLADNRSSDLATYDDKELLQLLKEVAGTDDELLGTLYDGDDLDDMVYKLEGSLGFVAEGQDIASIIEEYAEKDTRNLTLPYKQTEIGTVKKHLASLQTKMGLDNWSEIVLQVVKEADESN